MMRSLSTSAFGQPSETKLTFGAIFSSIIDILRSAAPNGPDTKDQARGGCASAISQRFRLGVELLFPFLLVFGAFADKGREDRQLEQKPVQETRRHLQRFDKIDEQHDAGVRRPVPGLMFESIVEHDDFTFLPAVNVFLDADAE